MAHINDIYTIEFDIGLLSLIAEGASLAALQTYAP